jgi:hypothetical protein
MPAERKMCVEMFKETDAHFMQWAIAAISYWEPFNLDGIRVFQIHGQKDRIIPVRAEQPDEIIPGGGHLINITHVQQVNAFIRKVLDKSAELAYGN